MADYNIVHVNPDQLVGSPTQPDSRLMAVGPMNHLKRSITEVGLQYPPLVVREPTGDKYRIVDGHRRVQCVRELMWSKIPVLVTQGKIDDLFAAVSGSVVKMKAYEWADVYLKGGVIPTGPNKTCVIKLEEHMGREYLLKLVHKKASPSIWNLSSRVLKYLDLTETKRKDVLNWLIDVGTREVSAWITGENSKDELLSAFKEGRTPLMGGGIRSAA